MLVRFTKNAPAAAADTLTCVRADGTTTTQPLPREAVLPSAACHLFIEQTLAWPDGLFARVAAGQSLVSVLARLRARPRPASVSPVSAASRGPRGTPGPHLPREEPLRQAEALARTLQATQWSGRSDPASFTAELTDRCRRLRVPAPTFTAAEIQSVRAALREFGAAWRPLASGAVLEKRFSP